MGYFCKKVCYQEVQQIAQSGHTGRGRRGGFLESNFCARKLHSTLFRASFRKSFVILFFILQLNERTTNWFLVVKFEERRRR